MRFRKLAGSVLLLAGSTAALAQQTAVIEEDIVIAAPPIDKAQIFERRVGIHAAPAPNVQTFEFISSEMGVPGKVVKGAPYSAEAVNETVQVLADGNKITRRNTSSLYRDGEGRTRREQKLPAIGPWASAGDAPTIVTITDPVADATYVLNSHEKVARKMKGAGGAFGAAFAMPVAGMAIAGGEPGHLKEKMRQPAVAASSGFHYSYSGAARTVNDQGKTEDLGKRNIEGVVAEGSRTTFTIPAGEIGNERPIEVVSERWYSPELQTVIMTKHLDPRMGETTYKLTRVSRNEPQRSLFEVPSDYEVKEAGPVMMRKLEAREK